MTALNAEGAADFLRRFRWLLAGAVLLIGAYAGAGFLLVPHLARGAIEDHVTDTLKRRVAIGEIAFNPFTLTAEVQGFALSEANGAPIVRFDSLLVNASLASVVNRAWTFEEIRLVKPDVEIDIDPAGAVNLAKLIPPGDEPSSGPPAVRIDRLSVEGGRIGFTDRNRPQPFSATLSPIRFALTDFRTAADHDNNYRFEGATTAGETLSWTGTFSVRPLGSRGSFSVAGLKSATIAAYLHDLMPFDVPTGTVSLSGTYDASLDGRIALNVAIPTVDVKDVSVLPKGAEGTPWITVPAVRVADIAVSLADRKVTVGEVRVTDPAATVRRAADGGINLSRLMPPATEAAAPVPAEPEANADAPWSISLGTLSVDGGVIDAEDAAVTPAVKLRLAPVAVSVKGYSTAPDAVLDIEASTGIGDARAAVTGKIVPQPLSADLTLDGDGLDIPLAQPYIDPFAALTVKSGRLSADGALAYRAEPAKGQPSLAFKGDVSVADFLTEDRAGKQEFVKWKRLTLKGIDYTQAPDRLTINLVEAREPYGRVIIGADRTVNVMQVLGIEPEPPAADDAAPADAPPAAAATASAKAADPAPGMPIRVRDVRITGGSANFADLSIEPNFAAALYDLEGSVKGLSSAPDSRATVHLAGKVDRYAPVDISGTVNLLSAQTFTDLGLTFRNIELTTFNPYSGKYAGYNITKGKLTTELHYKVEDRKLDASHHIVLDQLEFGAATGSKDAVPLPVRLAVSLLKDRHGVIDLDLPVTGSLDDPQFRIAPVVWQALRNLLGKIVTAPFALLGSLFGGGEEISYVDFAAGSAELAPDQAEKLSHLSRALAERPQLRLDIPLGAVTDADAEALAAAAFDAALAPFMEGREDTPEHRRKALAELYKAQLGDDPSYPETVEGEDKTEQRIAFLEAALRPRFEASPTAREALGRARAEAVQAVILADTQVAPERIFLSTGRPGKPSETGARLQLSLE